MGNGHLHDRAGASPPMPATEMAGKPEPILISADETARVLSISKRLVAMLTAAGELPVVRVRRRTLYSLEALRAWAASKQEGGR